MWTSHGTPRTLISLLQISAEDDTSDRVQYEWPSGFFELQLLPPPRGARVVIIGFPGLETKAAGASKIDIGAPFMVKEGTVTKIYQIRGDLGQLNFPCFELDIHVAGGFSGAPAFFEGRLCGVVSHSPSYEARSTIATLWPLALMKGRDRLGEWSIAAQLRNGSLQAHDWADVKSRISIEEDEHGNMHSSKTPARPKPGMREAAAQLFTGAVKPAYVCPPAEPASAAGPRGGAPLDTSMLHLGASGAPLVSVAERSRLAAQ